MSLDITKRVLLSTNDGITIFNECSCGHLNKEVCILLTKEALNKKWPNAGDALILNIYNLFQNLLTISKNDYDVRWYNSTIVYHPGDICLEYGGYYLCLGEESYTMQNGEMVYSVSDIGPEIWNSSHWEKINFNDYINGLNENRYIQYEHSLDTMNQSGLITVYSNIKSIKTLTETTEGYTIFLESDNLEIRSSTSTIEHQVMLDDDPQTIFQGATCSSTGKELTCYIPNTDLTESDLLELFSRYIPEPEPIIEPEVGEELEDAPNPDAAIEPAKVIIIKRTLGYRNNYDETGSEYQDSLFTNIDGFSEIEQGDSVIKITLTGNPVLFENQKTGSHGSGFKPVKNPILLQYITLDNEEHTQISNVECIYRPTGITIYIYNPELTLDEYIDLFSIYNQHEIQEPEIPVTINDEETNQNGNIDEENDEQAEMESESEPDQAKLYYKYGTDTFNDEYVLVTYTGIENISSVSKQENEAYIIMTGKHILDESKTFDLFGNEVT